MITYKMYENVRFKKNCLPKMLYLELAFACPEPLASYSANLNFPKCYIYSHKVTYVFIHCKIIIKQKYIQVLVLQTSTAIANVDFVPAALFPGWPIY